MRHHVGGRGGGGREGKGRRGGRKGGEEVVKTPSSRHLTVNAHD